MNTKKTTRRISLLIFIIFLFVFLSPHKHVAGKTEGTDLPSIVQDQSLLLSPAQGIDLSRNQSSTLSSNTNLATAWHTIFESDEIIYDSVREVTVDDNEMIYFVGSTGGSWQKPYLVDDYHGESDGFVAQLNSDGALQWYTFLGGAGYDHCSDIVVDGNGNIYVSGSSDESWGNPLNSFTPGTDPNGDPTSDVFLAKLNNQGELQWHTFSGSGDDDWGNEIAMDGAGNLYLSGSSYDTWGNPIRAFTPGTDQYGDPADDSFVASFDNNGIFQWNTFLGGTNADYSVGIGITDSNGIFIAGNSWATWGTPVNPHSRDSKGFLANLGYDGVLQWHTFIGQNSFAGDIDISTQGTVYVTGSDMESWGNPINDHYQSGNPDIFVVNIDPGNGEVNWNTFLGDSGQDWGSSIFDDAAGNIYIAGYSDVTWGNPIRPFNPWDGNSPLSLDGFVAKLDVNGNFQWNTFLGSDQRDQTNSITVSDSGSIYTGGYGTASWGTPIYPHSGGFDGSVEKLDSSGNLVWNSFFGDSPHTSASDIVASPNGDSYTVGTSEGSWGTPVRDYGEDIDTFVTKVNDQGQLQWHTFLGGSGTDYGKDIARDESGNTYVIGYSDASWGVPVRGYQGVEDTFVAKINDQGDLQWHTFLGSSDTDYGNGITYHDGGVFVTGRSYTTWGSPISPFTSRDAFVAELDSTTGELIWNTFVGAGSYEGDAVRTIVTDATGNVFVGGWSEDTWGNPVDPFASGSDGTDFDIFLAKFNSSGELQWNSFFGSTTMDNVDDLKLDSQGNLYLVGASWDTWGNPLLPFVGGTWRDGLVAKVSPVGELVWHTFLNFENPEGDDWAHGLVLDANENLLITGVGDLIYSSTTWQLTEATAFVVEMSNAGQILSTTYLDQYSPNTGQGIALVNDTSIYIAGSLYNDNDAFVDKLVKTCTFSGTINLQGRNDDSGATFTAGAYSTTTDASGYYELTVPEGTYDVTAEMDLYLDGERSQEVCPAEGMNELPTVTLLGGDTNDECVVNILDLSFMGARFMTSTGDSGFDPKADINADGTVNILDLTVAGANFLETCPVAWP